MVKAVQLAVREVNLAQIQTVQLYPGDSGTDPAVANNTADDLIADEVQGIVGAASSGISLSIIDKIVAAQIPMVSPSNTSPTFTDYDDGGFYFRTAATDALQGLVLGDAVTEQGGIDVAILFRSDDYGQSLANITQTQLESNGASVVASIALDPTGSTFTAQVQEAAASGADSVVLIAFEEGAKVIAQMTEAGIGPDVVNIFVPDGLASNDLWESVDPSDPSSVEGIRGTRPAPSANAEETFPDRFAEFAPGVDEVFSSNAYDAAIILVLAALVAGTNDPTIFASQINDVTRGGTKCSSYVDCANLALAGEDIDYDGASGPLDFVDAGEPGTGSYDIFEFGADGSLVEIGFVTLAI
jgi:branched-chain amino acid transport system substrate-binding protein